MSGYADYVIPIVTVVESSFAVLNIILIRNLAKCVNHRSRAIPINILRYLVCFNRFEREVQLILLRCISWTMLIQDPIHVLTFLS